MLAAVPIPLAELDGAEPLLERLDLAAEAVANLARLAGVAENALWHGERWAARVTLDGSDVLAGGDADIWAIHAPPGDDEADAMLAARKLHGRIGVAAEGWDLDR